MSKLNTQSADKYGYNNMRGERIKNVGTPKFGNDAMSWSVPSYTTVARDLIPSPKSGMLIFNSTTLKLNFYNGTSWIAVTS